MNWNALHEENGSGAANYTHAHEPGGGKGARLALVFGQATGVPFYAYHDHLGSVRRWRWSNKTSATAAEFDPYGGVHAWSGAALPRVFALHEHDPALGFHLAPHRAYAPAMARWTTRDPLGMVDGPNLYAYVRGNAIVHFDQLGLSKEKFRECLGVTASCIAICAVPCGCMAAPLPALTITCAMLCGVCLGGSIAAIWDCFAELFD